jgi:hypothetical protein
MQTSTAKLTSMFRFQGYIGATIINHMNHMLLVLKLINDWKEGSLYHEYRLRRLST